MPRPRSLLDGFFFPTAPADVLRARASLTDPSAAPADRSHGAVTSSYFMERVRGRTVTLPGGIMCQRIFGPLEALACACGRYRGAEHEGTVCEKCGVLCGSPALRDVRFAHVEVPGGLVHPALAPVIGAVLGISAEEVLAVARGEARFEGGRVVPSADDDGETGIDALRARLQAADRAAMPEDLAGTPPVDLLIDAVAVIPPGDRPLLRSDDPTVLAPQRGPINAAYCAFVERAARLRQLVQLDAPAVILFHERVVLQHAFDPLPAAVRGELPPPSRAWNAADAPPAPFPLVPVTPIPTDGSVFSPWWDGPPDPAVPCGAIWLDDERVLLQLPYVALVLSLADGRILGEHGTFGLTVRSIAEDGRRVVFLGPTPSHTSMYRDGLHLLDAAVLDVEAGRWLDTYAADLRAVTVINDQPEDAFLYDFRVEITERLDLASDRPCLMAISRDHRFVWAGGPSAEGRVISTDTGITHLGTEERRAEAPFLRPDGSLADTLRDEEEEDEDDDDDDEDEGWGAAALVLTPGGHFRTIDDAGVVSEDDVPRFTVGFRRDAAAFDARGERLFVASRERAVVIALGDEPKVALAIDLAPLAALLAPPPRLHFTEEQRDVLLQHIGTMRHLGALPDAVREEIGLLAETAKGLRAAAARLPDRLPVTRFEP